jgi:hypothetical protein
MLNDTARLPIKQEDDVVLAASESHSDTRFGACPIATGSTGWETSTTAMDVSR